MTRLALLLVFSASVGVFSPVQALALARVSFYCFPEATLDDAYFERGFELQVRGEQAYLNAFGEDGTPRFHAHYAPGRIESASTPQPDGTLAGYWHHGYDETLFFPEEIFSTPNLFDSLSTRTPDEIQGQVSFFSQQSGARLETYVCIVKE